MITLSDYIPRFCHAFPAYQDTLPWEITSQVQEIIRNKIQHLNDEYAIAGDIAIHRTAIVEEHVVLKGPIIIGANTFVGAHAYLRGGVYLDEHSSIGPGCEIKSSFIMSHTALAHFNFIGDSLVGSSVNLEAGAIVANHYNERKSKTIFVLENAVSTGVTKFGALIGDQARIGANAVLSPGTILPKNAVVKRLELVEQNHQ